MRSLVRAVAAVALLATAVSAAPDWESFQAQPYAPPKAAPAFSLPALDGRMTGLSDLRGKLTLLFFWATW